MLDLVTEATTLGMLLEETRGVVGVVLGTEDGEVRGMVGAVRDGETGASVAAALSNELNRIGALLGLGELGVVSIKAASAARVVAQQSGAVLVIELDPKRPLGELETKLRTLAWAPDEEALEGPAVNRAPTLPRVSPPRVAPPPIPIATPMATPPPLPPPPSATIPVPMGSSAPAIGVPPPPPPGVRTVRSVRPTPPPTPAARVNAAGSITSHAKSVGSGPVFAGDLEEFSLPDLLEFLRNSQRTGLLVCSSTSGTGTVHLWRGLIVAADSPHALDLREHFVTNMDLAPELRRTLAALPHEAFEDEMIDDVLVSRDLVARDELERARTARIYSAFREMMVWTSGRFSFDPAVPIVTNPSLALSAQNILMQIYQEQDELER
jgi:hypothetical protein